MRCFLSAAARRAEADAALKAAAVDAVWSRTPEARAVMLPPPPGLLDDAHVGCLSVPLFTFSIEYFYCSIAVCGLFSVLTLEAVNSFKYMQY